ncbi:hypothetical protein EHR05_11205 [Leptospira licerasiae]|nr:hypothetical protein EHR05_11205 [Leptospira licerasiae]
MSPFFSLSQSSGRNSRHFSFIPSNPIVNGYSVFLKLSFLAEKSYTSTPTLRDDETIIGDDNGI